MYSFGRSFPCEYRPLYRRWTILSNIAKETFKKSRLTPSASIIRCRTKETDTCNAP